MNSNKMEKSPSSYFNKASKVVTTRLNGSAKKHSKRRSVFEKKMKKTKSEAT